MSTKAQRLQKRIAKTHGAQFALERAVLNAARALMGAINNHGRAFVPDTTWERFIRAERALHVFHADRQRKDAVPQAVNSVKGTATKSVRPAVTAPYGRTDSGGQHG